MKARGARLGGAALAALAAAVFAHGRLEAGFRAAPPPMESLALDPSHGLQDLAFAAAGFRSLGADLAWIQFLQYLGRNLHRAGDTALPELQMKTLRVVRLDPWFHRAYLYGAGILAWQPGVNRVDEAIELLEEGRRWSPDYWPFTTWLAAIGYKKQEKFHRMAALLEEAIRHPDCPPMIKSILANTYKAQGRYLRALRLWEELLGDPAASDYHLRAADQISELSKKLGAKKR